MQDTEKPAVLATDPFASPATMLEEKRWTSPDDHQRSTNEPEEEEENVHVKSRHYAFESDPRLLAREVAALDDADLDLLRNTVELEYLERSPEHRGEKLFDDHAKAAIIERHELTHTTKATWEEGARTISGAISRMVEMRGGNIHSQDLRTSDKRCLSKTVALSYWLADTFKIKASYQGFRVKVWRIGRLQEIFTGDTPEEVIEQMAGWSVLVEEK